MGMHTESAIYSWAVGVVASKTAGVIWIQTDKGTGNNYDGWDCK